MPNKKRPLTVFLCHAHEDKDTIFNIYDLLTKDGVDVWLDKKKLLPGQDWELEIRRAVRSADVIVVCLSKRFNQDGFRQKEVRLALDTAMEKPEGEIFIIPARLDECDVIESLKRWHWVDMFQDDGYTMLMRALYKRAKTIGAIIQKETKPSTEVENIAQGDQAEIRAVQNILEERYSSIIYERNMQLVGEALRDILSEHGIGVALLVAHLHGLKVGHIPQVADNSGQDLKQVEIIHDRNDRYTFVHVPVRVIRTDKNELIKRGIMNKKADPTGFIYHEDGLISNFSFDLDTMN